MSQASGKASRGIERLTPKEIAGAKLRSDELSTFLNDGGGLYLVLKRVDGVVYKNWRFRFTSPVHARTAEDGSLVYARREIGLKSADAISLAGVRLLARQYREAVALGNDPLDGKRAAKAAKRDATRAEAERKKVERARERYTLLRVTRDYHERVVEPKKSSKDSSLWINAIEQHIPKPLLAKPIEDIQARELLDALLAKRTEVPETARRIVQRLGLVFADAKLRGLVPTNLIADIKPALRETTRDRAMGRKNFASLPFAEVPALVQRLQGTKGVSAKALEFTIRCAARTAETVGATWAEIDLKKATWTVPANRMKAGEQHVVHLAPRAVEILEEMAKLNTPYVFPSTHDMKEPISNMAMLGMLRRFGLGDVATVHGFRASFSTWAYEVAQRARPDLAREDVIEACLAHSEGNRVKAAYSRSKFDAERRELLALWREFIDSEPAQVLDIAQGQAKRAQRKSA